MEREREVTLTFDLKCTKQNNRAERCRALKRRKKKKKRKEQQDRTAMVVVELCAREGSSRLLVNDAAVCDHLRRSMILSTFGVTDAIS